MGFLLVITNHFSSNAEVIEILDTVTDCKNKINKWANECYRTGLNATFEIMDVEDERVIYTAMCERRKFHVISHGGHIPNGVRAPLQFGEDIGDGDISFFSP